MFVCWAENKDVLWGARSRLLRASLVQACRARLEPSCVICLLYGPSSALFPPGHRRWLASGPRAPASETRPTFLLSLLFEEPIFREDLANLIEQVNLLLPLRWLFPEVALWWKKWAKLLGTWKWRLPGGFPMCAGPSPAREAAGVHTVLAPMAPHHHVILRLCAHRFSVPFPPLMLLAWLVG